MQTGEMPTENSERPVHKFSADPKVFEDDRQSIKGSSCDRSFCIQCSIDSPPLNGTENFRNFQSSRKRDNLERLTEYFEMSFRTFSVPFDFEPEFSEILVEWKLPVAFRLFGYYAEVPGLLGPDLFSKFIFALFFFFLRPTDPKFKSENNSTINEKKGDGLKGSNIR